LDNQVNSWEEQPVHDKEQKTNASPRPPRLYFTHILRIFYLSFTYIFLYKTNIYESFALQERLTIECRLKQLSIRS